MLQISNPITKFKVTQETKDILRLIRSENIGPKTFYELVKFFGSAANALRNASELSIRGGRSKPIQICSVEKAEKEIEDYAKIGANIISYKDSCYPKLLKQLYDAPPIISCLGNKNILTKKLVSIVGARNASLNAKILCKKISSKLTESGFTIVSGLARGIDTEAHTSAIDSTIAVLAGGVDYIYPPENKILYDNIKSKGAIIAELPVGTNPLAKHFPQRNRIIASMSRSTIVIEAGLKSGSLITANFAIQNNREVCAVPGFPLDYRSSGTNKLIKEGAFVVDSIENLLHHLITLENYQTSFCDMNSQKYQSSNITLPTKIDDQTRKNFTSLLSACPITIDELYDESGLSFTAMQTIILELELAGRITRHPGNMISLNYVVK